jgi:phospholipid/cholesterol/gamma-HCH transport system substrate-binding protein
METRANHVLIGLFTLAVLVGGFVFVWWFGGSGASSDRAEYRVVFEGSVAGLTKGSAVQFNGLTVGEVTDIQFSPSDPGKIYTKIAVSSGVPMRTDTKARLDSQGLTGVSTVMLIGGRPEAPVLAATSAGDLPTIIAEPSSFQSLIEGARQMMARADGILNQVQRVVEMNAGPINQSITNVQKFTDALAKNADGIDTFLAATSDMARCAS